MIVELGHFLLACALASALLQSTLPVIGAFRNEARLMDVGTTGALASFALIALSYLALTWAYATSDFSVINVWENSHSLMPMVYKISGVWGNHEGSMMLWLLILAFFSALVAAFGGNLPKSLKANALAVQGWITVAFLLFILLTSNPFLRTFGIAELTPPPAEGRDLNPVLQDFGLAIHPPLLYLGYVGFSVCFSFAVAALIEGRIDAAWARWVRPWTLLAWTFLTAGIAMGSYWAYYELGWGGWWFWDPVENASFMPWLAGTALLHSALVMEKRDALKIWTVLLAIMTFSLSLLGTFLVRSGVLTSVHAFASDPSRGVFILVILSIFIGGAFALFALRSASLAPGGLFQPVSREGALVLNNVILVVATGAILTGTLYPLLLESLTSEKISVGAPFFNIAFSWLMAPLFVVLPFGPLLAWKRGDLRAASRRLGLAFVLSLCLGVAVWVARGDGPMLAALGLIAGFWLVSGALVDLWQRAGFAKAGFANGLRRLIGLPRSAIGTMLAHLGLGVSVLGVVLTTAWSTEHILEMKPGDTTENGAYTVRFDDERAGRGPNYTEDAAHFSVLRDGVVVAETNSAKRIYTARQMPTTEAGIISFGASQLYISIGDKNPEGEHVVRIWWKPWILFIWGGAVVMMIGGFVSLSDRRLRVGAPSKRARAVAAPGALEAAE
ncbi:cytochrome c-type biogenesis protein CcmF [Rhizobium sp. SG_E_25_P2]|uniref:heme lyase CcmF/NrfE family subunit n=1 Tax=Rhizobium sp. SG_E_25_P2 TaxID=2879942 RepID=UPI002473EA4D|nr:heme lyase CcmF/NrfE family subunit [Rhizobium sp. SG_E_25_P2]MDH6268344.1 cytochrome c-type biogenesis protein CcmF [Rhizobium sp. SG_E_25_P2]